MTAIFTFVLRFVVAFVVVVVIKPCGPSLLAGITHWGARCGIARDDACSSFHRSTILLVV
eukprot:2646440-Amphidinium_carterae.1